MMFSLQPFVSTNVIVRTIFLVYDKLKPMNKTLLFIFIFTSNLLVAQTWEQAADFPDGRHHPISFTLNGMGYAVTGTASDNQPTNSTFQYNPEINAWSILADFPGEARSFGIGTVTNGKAYLGFGATNTAYLNDFWSFDATDSSWTQLADCECTGRRHPAMVAIGDKIFVGLGDDFTGDKNDWWVYTISADKWNRISDLPGPARHHPFMFTIGDDLYAGLGHSGNVIYRDWYKLDTATMRWTAARLFPGEARVAGTQFSANGFGYVLSGDGDNHSYMETGEMWQYDAAFDEWIELPPHPGISRWAPGSFVINNEVYFFGGLNRLTNRYPTIAWKYTLGNATASVLNTDFGYQKKAIYPNPANSTIYWENDFSSTEVSIYNNVGQLYGTCSTLEQQMDVSQFPNGIYFLQFYDETKIIKQDKVLIQH